VRAARRPPRSSRKPGGGGTGGAFPTREGRAFLARYRRFRTALDRLAGRRFTRVFEEDS
jgi:molybdenum-dependent DNA-binding transcriptional regulator ModE